MLGFQNHEGEWGHMGFGTVMLVVNAVFLWLYSISCHSCRHIIGGRLKHFSRHPIRYKAWGVVSKLNTKHMQIAWASLLFVALTDLYIRLVAPGGSPIPDSSDGPNRPNGKTGVTMSEYERHDYDVIVIGAGGAGLRAAIAAHDAGARTAVICKSLLGKAHTVMAEGGIAAAMGNLYPEDNWQVHFRDTMRGGKLLNHWRMAELHAKEAPDRVYELEQWGALFDRTSEGLISQRDFGGHRYARLAHVGDRTGLEMIRTLQQRAVSLGIDVFMEFTITRLLKDAGGQPHRRRLRLLAGVRAVRRLRCARR